MSKNLQAFSIIFLGLSIVISSWIISEALITNNSKVVEKQEEKVQNQTRYDYIIRATDYIIIFYTQTGDYWEKVGGRQWEKYTHVSNTNN